MNIKIGYSADDLSSMVLKNQTKADMHRQTQKIVPDHGIIHCGRVYCQSQFLIILSLNGEGYIEMVTEISRLEGITNSH